MESIRYPEHMVFGLDIGTRSIVGTVGYKENERQFKVVAQVTRLHETRAMMDGQIHDIGKVSDTIRDVKNELERKIGRQLNDVCIAAAGRVLKTLTVTADFDFEIETIVTNEHIHSLNLLAVENAYEQLREESKQDKINFYCVGYTVIRYFLNDYAISNLEGHKALKIKTELLATFLPEEVVDGLHAAVEKAGLYVANLTLEPIAAINVAIPEKFRLLNLALVDVGAGTSDISITKDGSIVAYGMMPFAGDELTEKIATTYLVDFASAEKMKMDCGLENDTIIYYDIIGIEHEVAKKEILESIDETVRMITENIAKKIIELNGDKAVSAVFIVGGGGKLPGFKEYIANYLGIVEERVALRGAEVMQEIEFLEKDIQKDSLLVTPVGICLNFYEQKNNFIFVNVNGQRIKLYDNDKLTIVDAAMQIGFPNEVLFPRRGKPINFTLNGEKRLVRGAPGEAAVVKLNGIVVGINTAIQQNDKIEIQESTIGADASYDVGQLPEYNGTIQFICNGTKITCPKFVMVNGELVSEFYSIQDGDELEILNYYTLKQVLEFMDIECKGTILVNHVPATLEEKVYENFSIQCDIQDEYYYGEEMFDIEKTETLDEEMELAYDEGAASRERKQTESNEQIEQPVQQDIVISVVVNGEEVLLKNKASYILVDVLDFYPFDTSVAKGNQLITKVNGEPVDFTFKLQAGDVIEIYWE